MKNATSAIALLETMKRVEKFRNSLDLTTFHMKIHFQVNDENCMLFALTVSISNLKEEKNVHRTDPCTYTIQILLRLDT